ncbi:helix-turn-helix domain-containing protein [Streptomyces sp. NPDC002788]
MGAAEETADFAALLRALKQRSGLSYEALAKRAHMSTSTLHRYCKGEGVPADYASVSRFARVCKATPEEVVELHRRWVMADAARERSRQAAAGRAERTPAAAGQERAPEPGSAREHRAPEPGSEPERAPERAAGPAARPAAGRESAAVPEPGAAAAAAAVPASVSGPGPTPESVPAPGSALPPEVEVRTQGSVLRRFGFRKRGAVVAASTVAVVALSTAIIMNPDRGEDSADVRPEGAVTLSTAPSASPGSASPSKSPSARPSRSSASKTPSAKPSASVSGGAAAAAPDSPPDAAPEDGPVPLTVSARAHDWEDYCGTFYLVDRLPAQVPLPPPTIRDAPKWASDVGAVSAGRHRVSVTVQGTGDKAVVIESLHVRVVGSNVPLPWTAYVMGVGCGGGVEPREFGLDLDAARPTVKPKGGQRGFPYKVSQSDPEVLHITSHTDTRDVKWYLELQWSSGGRQGTIEIRDGEKPFHTTSMTGRPLYGHVPGRTEWIEQEQQR